jgi:hypothetical protein
MYFVLGANHFFLGLPSSLLQKKVDSTEKPDAEIKKETCLRHSKRFL